MVQFSLKMVQFSLKMVQFTLKMVKVLSKNLKYSTVSEASQDTEHQWKKPRKKKKTVLRCQPHYQHNN